MVKVVFTGADKEYKKAFQIGIITGHSKKLEVQEASEIVRNVAKGLEGDDQITISFTVIDDQGTSSDIKDATVKAEDGSTGLISVMNRVADENGNDEASLEVLGLIQGTLEPKTVQGELVEDEEDEDEEDEFNPWEAQPEQVKKEEKGDSSTNEETKEESSPLEGATQESTSEKEDTEKTGKPSSEEKTTEKVKPEAPKYDVNNINIDSFINGDTYTAPVTASEEPSSAENTTQAQQPIRNDKEEVMSIQDFAETKSIFESIDRYDADFDINKAIKTLGYVENPTDKYQRELNNAILQFVDDSGMSQIQSEFTSGVEKLKQDAKSRLTLSYSEIQDIPVAQAVEEVIAEDVSEAQTSADQDIDGYTNEAQRRLEANKKEYESTIEAEVERYRQELQEKYDQKLADDTEIENEKIKDLTDLRNEKLDEELNDLRKQTEESIIADRNSALIADKQKIDNTFQEELNALFETKSKTFADGLAKLRDQATIMTKTVEKHKKSDEEEALRLKHEEEDRQERKRLNDLKERELELKEREAEQRRKYEEEKLRLEDKNNKARNKAELARQKREFALKQKELETQRKQNEAKMKQMLDQKAEELKLRKQDIELRQKELETRKKALTEISSKSGPVLVSKKPSNDEETTLSVDKPQATILPVNLDEDINPAQETSLVPLNDDTENKPKKKNRVVPLTVVALLGFLGLGIGYTMTHQKTAAPATQVTKSNTNSSSSRSSNSSAKKQKEEAKTSENHENGAKSHKQKDNKKVSLNLRAYESAKTWQDKVDILNGALGQHDDRALKQINDSKSATKLSRLYEALVLKDDASVRQIYSSMTPSEKKDLSRSAANSTALAFYNIHDWQGGWEARNGL